MYMAIIPSYVVTYDGEELRVSGNDDLEAFISILLFNGASEITIKKEFTGGA